MYFRVPSRYVRAEEAPARVYGKSVGDLLASPWPLDVSCCCSSAFHASLLSKYFNANYKTKKKNIYFLELYLSSNLLQIHAEKQISFKPKLRTEQNIKGTGVLKPLLCEEITQTCFLCNLIIES